MHKMLIKQIFKAFLNLTLIDLRVLMLANLLVDEAQIKSLDLVNNTCLEEFLQHLC